MSPVYPPYPQFASACPPTVCELYGRHMVLSACRPACPRHVPPSACISSTYSVHLYVNLSAGRPSSWCALCEMQRHMLQVAYQPFECFVGGISPSLHASHLLIHPIAYTLTSLQAVHQAGARCARCSATCCGRFRAMGKSSPPTASSRTFEVSNFGCSCHSRIMQSL